MAGDVYLHIDELVLHGVAVSDRDRVAEAVRQELEALLRAQGVPPALASGRSVDALAAPPPAAPTGRGDIALGAEVARAVYRGMRG